MLQLLTALQVFTAVVTGGCQLPFSRAFLVSFILILFYGAATAAAVKVDEEKKKRNHLIITCVWTEKKLYLSVYGSA